MRRETYNVRESLHRSGEWLDGMVYALLADEHQPHTPPPARGLVTRRTPSRTPPHPMPTTHTVHRVAARPTPLAVRPARGPAPPSRPHRDPGPPTSQDALAVTRPRPRSTPKVARQPSTSDHRPARPLRSPVLGPHFKEVHDAHTRLARHISRPLAGHARGRHGVPVPARTRSQRAWLPLRLTARPAPSAPHRRRARRLPHRPPAQAPVPHPQRMEQHRGTQPSWSAKNPTGQR